MKTIDRRTILLTGGMALGYGALPCAAGTLARPSAAGTLVRPPSSGAGGGSAARPPHRPAGVAQTGEVAALAVSDAFPTTDPELVAAFVGAAHTEIDTVRDLVTMHPALARATIDWGFGDWESALGAASHMGRRDIAELLIAHGARPDIFCAAMLGQLAVVRAFVEASPGVQRIPGPHGITLLAHARAGGEAAAPVHAFLEALGDADLHPPTVEMSAERRARFHGTYRFGDGDNDYFAVDEARDVLSIRRGAAPFGRRMFPVSDTEFYPSGSPAVRIAFDLEGGRATSLHVIDHERVVSAARAG